MSWETEDLFESHRQAVRDLWGNTPVRPTGPTKALTPEEWAEGRPDWLAPFWCRCGLVYHVRRHYDDHAKQCVTAAQNQEDVAA